MYTYIILKVLLYLWFIEKENFPIFPTFNIALKSYSSDDPMIEKKKHTNNNIKENEIEESYE